MSYSRQFYNKNNSCEKKNKNSNTSGSFFLKIFGVMMIAVFLCGCKGEMHVSDNRRDIKLCMIDCEDREELKESDDNNDNVGDGEDDDNFWNFNQDNPKQDYSDAESVTIMCYFNGSNLETDYGLASEDIKEIVDGEYNENVNIVIQTVGTRSWDDVFDIEADHSQRFLVKDDDLELVDDDLEQLDCTNDTTLSDFIKWGKEEYPADRYILIMWDHGAGPIYGFGYDEWNENLEAGLTLDELQQALKDGGVYFDFVGMDCCVMSCAEVCWACREYCDYMILSEDFESGLGWSYEGWISAIADDVTIPTTELGQMIVDDMVYDNEHSRWEGGRSILALIDVDAAAAILPAWIDFAYANAYELLQEDMCETLFFDDEDMVHPILLENGNNHISKSLDEEAAFDVLYGCYAVDILSITENIDSDESTKLSELVNNSIVYCDKTDDEPLNGMAITLPYGDRLFYTRLKYVYSQCGIDKEYTEWVRCFAGYDLWNMDFDFYEYSIWDG